MADWTPGANVSRVRNHGQGADFLGFQKLGNGVISLLQRNRAAAGVNRHGISYGSEAEFKVDCQGLVDADFDRRVLLLKAMHRSRDLVLAGRKSGNRIHPIIIHHRGADPAGVHILNLDCTLGSHGAGRIGYPPRDCAQIVLSVRPAPQKKNHHQSGNTPE